MIQSDGYDVLSELIAQREAEKKKSAMAFVRSLADAYKKEKLARNVSISDLLPPDEIYPGTKVPERVRKEMIAAHLFLYGGLYCPECKQFVTGDDKLSVDHIIPPDKGGKNSRSNFRIICLRCNQKKSDKWPFWL